VRILLDTNIILDFILQRPDFYDDANDIFIRLQNLEFQAFVTSVTAINAFYTAKKEIGREAAFETVENLISLVDICNSDKDYLTNAFTLNFADYEDAVQCASAMAAGLDAIVTRDTKDFQNSPIPVYSPRDFLAILLKS